MLALFEESAYLRQTYLNQLDLDLFFAILFIKIRLIFPAESTIYGEKPHSDKESENKKNLKKIPGSVPPSGSAPKVNRVNSGPGLILLFKVSWFSIFCVITQTSRLTQVNTWQRERLGSLASVKFCWTRPLWGFLPIKRRWCNRCRSSSDKDLMGFRLNKVNLEPAHYYMFQWLV